MNMWRRADVQLPNYRSLTSGLERGERQDGSRPHEQENASSFSGVATNISYPSRDGNASLRTDSGDGCNYESQYSHSTNNLHNGDSLIAVIACHPGPANETPFLVQGAGAIPRNEPRWIHDLLRHTLASMRLLRARLVKLRRQSVTTNVHHALLVLGLV